MWSQFSLLLSHSLILDSKFPLPPLSPSYSYSYYLNIASLTVPLSILYHLPYVLLARTPFSGNRCIYGYQMGHELLDTRNRDQLCLESNSRGTLDILWSCLFTIIACTWTIQHLNVPEERNARDRGWKGDLKSALKRTWISTKWMVATILAPELVLSKAWEDLFVAKDGLAELQRLSLEDGTEWTLAHSLFANMGGFFLRENANRGTEASTITRQGPGNTYHTPFHLTANGIARLRYSG